MSQFKTATQGFLLNLGPGEGGFWFVVCQLHHVSGLAGAAGEPEGFSGANFVDSPWGIDPNWDCQVL